MTNSRCQDCGVDLHFPSCGVCEKKQLYAQIERLENVIKTIDFWLDEWGAGYARVPRDESVTPEMVADSSRKMHTYHLQMIASITQSALIYHEALQQVLVDINDPHPRNSTIEGFRDSLKSTEKYINGVLG